MPSCVFVLNMYATVTTTALAHKLIKNRHGVESCHSKIAAIVVNKMGSRRQVVNSRHTLDLRPNSKVIVVAGSNAVCWSTCRQHCRSDRATIVGSYTLASLSTMKVVINQKRSIKLQNELNSKPRRQHLRHRQCDRQRHDHRCHRCHRCYQRCCCNG